MIFLTFLNAFENPDPWRNWYDFLIEAFAAVGGLQLVLVGAWQREDREAMGKVFLHPAAEFGGGIRVVAGEGFETGLGRGEAGVGVATDELEAAEAGGLERG